ncbi:MAG: UDP-N-acetylglucosamine 2-epimerase (non-hydrolyzing) [Bacillus sp. (in: firmicutes)]
MKIVSVVGARPQFIKATCLSRALRSFCEEVLIHTGQHYDQNMSDVFFKQLQLPVPDYNLGVGSGTHGEQTAKMMEGIEPILIKEKPDLVLVYGDTNSTLAGSLTAAKMQIPIAHVEAGLRSYNRAMPEEINRVVTDHLSNLLFCPTSQAVKNLQCEGFRDHIHLVGDIMYDSVLFYKDESLKQSIILKTLKLIPKKYCLATIHRQENTNHPKKLKSILEAFQQLGRMVVLPLHPRTKKCIQQWNLEDLLLAPNILVIPPCSYLDSLRLVNDAEFILTDSGGLQKEAYILEVPCITLRDETEWVETVETGWNHVVGSNTDRILEMIDRLVIPETSPAVFGDGHSADHICRIIQTYLQVK